MKTTGWDSIIMVTVEPSKELSRMLGVPYLVQKSVTLRELFRNGVVDNEDIEEMKKGEILTKQIKVKS